MSPRGLKPSQTSRERWFFPLVTLPVFTVYLATLNPSLFRNDSPETITACWTLGVSHPPGYPLFTLLGRLGTLLPVGNPAFTLNLFACLCGTLGAYFFFRVCRAILEWTGNPDTWSMRLAALSGTYVFAFSKSYWSASLAAKGGVYAFQAGLELATLAFLLGSLKGTKTPWGPRGSFGILVFLIGLGLAHQWPTELLFLAAAGMTLFAFQRVKNASRPSLSAKAWVTGAVFGILALSTYLYIPLRALRAPALNFGDPSNAARFLGSLLRTRYFKTETMASSIDRFWPTLSQKALYLSDRFSWEFPVLFSLLALYGIWTLWRLAPRTFLLFLLASASVTVGANLVYLQVGPIDFWHLDDHLMTLNWVTGLLGVAGLCALFGWLTKKKKWTWSIPVLLLLFPALTLFQSVPFTDQTREFLYRGIGMEALRSMDRDPRYYAESDFDYFSLLYLREVEGKRRDLDLCLTTFLDERDWRALAASGRTDVEHLRPRYCAFANGDLVNGLLKETRQVSFYPTGTVIRFLEPGSPSLTKTDRQPLDEFWGHYLHPALSAEAGLNPINGLMTELCAHPYLNMANYLRIRGIWDDWDRYYLQALLLIQEKRWRAETWSSKAEGDLISGNKNGAAIGFFQAALVYQKLGMVGETKNSFQKALSANPNVKIQDGWITTNP